MHVTTGGNLINMIKKQTQHNSTFQARMTDVSFQTSKQQDAGLCGGDIASLGYMLPVLKDYIAFIFNS